MGTKKSNLVIKPVKVGFRQNQIKKLLLDSVIPISKKGSDLFSSASDVNFFFHIVNSKY